MSDVNSSVGRERLLAAARELYMLRGASNVGINDVTARAGVARMTLYNNFPSKDALTSAVYQRLAQDTLKSLQELVVDAASDEQNILAIFDHFATKETDVNYRGCAFIHAGLQPAEAAGDVYDIVHDYKLALRRHVYGLIDHNRRNRDELADQMLLLLDGAVTEAYLRGATNPVAAAKRAVAVLFESSRQSNARSKASAT